MRFLIAVLLVGASLGTWADDGRSRLNLTIGPAWRARMKSSISGGSYVSAGASSYSSSTSKRIVRVEDPLMPDYDLYADEVTVTETIGTPGNPFAALGSSDRNSPLGLKAAVGYDFYSSEKFAVGLNLKFAAFWNMRSSASGMAGGGSVRTQSETDYYLYEDGPYPDDADFSFSQPSATPYAPYHQSSSGDVIQYPMQSVHARIRSDLYQIGLGPKATWHALDWLDAYVGVEALCNIASLDFDCNGSNSSETLCRIGFGGNAGLAAYLTDCLGVYAEVGYEWIDKTDTSVGGAHAEVDFSSLVISVGLMTSF